MLDFVLIYQMFDDTRKGNQKPIIESNRQCISEKKKDRKTHYRKTHYAEGLILHITNQLKPEGGNSGVTAKMTQSVLEIVLGASLHKYLQIT